MDDTATIATDNQELDLPSDAKEDYVGKFAEELYTSLVGTGVPTEEFKKVFDILPDLLKLFAVRLGATAAPEHQKDAVTFVRHHRK